MAVIKCKMCGGDLVIEAGSTVAECEYCGSKQTIPTQDNEKKLTLFSRANRLRMNSEFDKAFSIYESIVAEFPEEAEAYWGLVLCKYGIEYVDDPATGKKIPTCHRSSFESVMEDSDLEQAVENADVLARRVYREEAKQIEEIRKGILEVSGKEEPYDIFICYKETDENGDRTIDSVIAQDVYDALTDKGYRVFFSRISLEDKLGQEYEPYIFAALNSAKIMLAFGTDYEYYNAVWVKNEWSRYLKLMAKDKNKHLIPCYMNIDAYDMPKEFAKLQAQDMGKVGAVQDLLRGIAKILPRESVRAVQTQEHVIVQTVGGSKADALLKRGFMALEDKEWQKADGFFEEVLNQNAECAEAYFGKLLALKKQRSIGDYFTALQNQNQNASMEQLKACGEDTAHSSKIAGECAVPGYLEGETIRKLYAYNLSYSSVLSCRKNQKGKQLAELTSEKLLNRARQYAQGEFKQALEDGVKSLIDILDKRIAQAQREDEEKIARIKKAYQSHINQTDEKIQKMWKNAEERREKDYQSSLLTLNTASTVAEFQDAKKLLLTMKGYKDTAELAKKCQQEIDRITEEERRSKERQAAEKKAREEAARKAAEEERREEERKRVEAEHAAAQLLAEQQQRKKRNILITVIAVVTCIAAFLMVTKVIIPNQKYNAAVELLNQGQYDAAVSAFEALGEYKNSQEQVLASYYAKAQALLENGDSVHAAMSFGKARDYKDAREQALSLWHQEIKYDTISVCYYLTVGINNGGKVLITGRSNYGNLDLLREEEDIISVCTEVDDAVGLKSDGTVVCTDKHGTEKRWKDIVAISSGGFHTVGLKTDGTVVVDAGWVPNKNFGQGNTDDWNDIVAVCAGGYHTVGLKSDGTVVAVGKNTSGQCNVENWTNIVAICAGDDHTVGLKADGTVVAVGENYYGQCDTANWNNVTAVSARDNQTLGLRADGTVVAVGNNYDGQCDVSDWKNIVAICAGGSDTLGLKSDGTLVGIGWSLWSNYTAPDWTDIRLPNK